MFSWDLLRHCPFLIVIVCSCLAWSDKQSKTRLVTFQSILQVEGYFSWPMVFLIPVHLALDMGVSELKRMNQNMDSF